MEDKKLNETESIELITRMINNTKQNLEKGSGNTFIIWGCSCLITTAVVSLLLLLTGQQVYNWLWMLIPVIGYTWTRLAGTHRTLIFTEIDRMISQTWRVIGIAAISIPLVIYLLVIIKQDLILSAGIDLFRIIPILEVLVCSIGLAVSGCILNFKVCICGGSAGIVISLLMFLDFPWAIPFWFAIWAIACMIIPGIKLNQFTKKAEHHV